MKPREQVLEIWGELACFTRPELKVERFSYPVITPSSARGIFDAIYWKPKFRWAVTRIEVLEPPRYIALRRNEVKDKVALDAVAGWMRANGPITPIFADGDKDQLGTDQKGRTQRQTMALKNVRYRLHGEIRPWPGYTEEIVCMEAQFRRRAARGQCVHQPYCGCREFPAYFTLLDAAPTDPPPPLDLDIGFMLYDVFDLSRPGGNQDSPAISLFAAQVVAGILDVPEYDSPNVLKSGKAV